ncbi:MAG: Gfo/Idh/MocA family oxidoreductase, partial [Calditrichota bacterium]
MKKSLRKARSSSLAKAFEPAQKKSAISSAGEDIFDLGKPLRLGFVGVGDQGSWHLDVALGIPDVVIPALCDIDPSYLHRAKRWVEQSGRPTPTLYDRGKTDFERLCAEEDLDAVICATSWEWHAPVLLAAMKNDKHGISEVPVCQSVEEAWELVETYEKTGKFGTLGFKTIHSALSNMVHQGVFGDILQFESGYIHDLRLVKFDPEREPWRLQHSVDRNGNLYPDHPTARAIPLMDINHKDRFDYLVSMSSTAQMLNKYAAHKFGTKHPYAGQKMAQGDYNATLLRTVNGKTYTLNFDTNTPHPRGITRMQGTKGVVISGSGIGQKIYLDGVSPEEH